MRRERPLSRRRTQVALLVVASLGSGVVAAWSGVAGHAVAAGAWALAGVAWAVVALDGLRKLRVTTVSSADPGEAPPDQHDSRLDSPRADAINRVVEAGEVSRHWTVAADTTQGAMRRGALLLSDRALYSTFEVGPGLERRTARIPIAAITDISRLPPRRVGIRYRTPSGDTRSIVVDLPPRDDADVLVRALVDARRAEAGRATGRDVGRR